MVFYEHVSDHPGMDWAGDFRGQVLGQGQFLLHHVPRRDGFVEGIVLEEERRRLVVDLVLVSDD